MLAISHCSAQWITGRSQATGDGSGIQLTWSCRRQCVTVTDVRTADVSACGRGSATILEIRVLTPTDCSGKLEDVDGHASFKKSVILDRF